MTTVIRGKDWVFNALWAACGSGVYGSNQCILNIPVTFTFKDGKPNKVITTDPATGKVTRMFLDSIQLERFDYSKGFRGSSLHDLRALRKVLDDYSIENRYYVQPDQDEPYVAKVTYTDDQTECLTGKTLDVLLRNDAWRQQVLLIQGYIPTTSTQSGLYSQQPHVSPFVG
jgi:hypothetical protein